MNYEKFRISRNFNYGKEESNRNEEFWSITHGLKEKHVLDIIIVDGINGNTLDEYEENYPEGGSYDDED
ncbi:hypothetical protein [Aquimarina agarivorans]|uniref:hypothetical protein n=1 Tax=Aquimarina agarivorans TaxID=980584 RepID=UPI000248F5F3|nr:hypothetical protein [Aquimarina agarivorans]